MGIKLHKLSRHQRLDKLMEQGVLQDLNVNLLKNVSMENICSITDNFIENSIGCFPLPLGIIIDCLVDNQFINVPLAVEETSIIAGLNKTRKLFNQNGGVVTKIQGEYSIGQIYLDYVDDVECAKRLIAKNQNILLDFINSQVLSSLKSRGGGACAIEVRHLEGHSIVIHVYFDVCDAMGANLINMALESIKPRVEDLLKSTVNVCILSNLNDKKVIHASVQIANLDRSLKEKIAIVSKFANIDIYRAATNNKGIMNAVDAIAIATGNDWRAIEAGAHAFAACQGKYTSLSKWVVENDCLIGTIAMPMEVGIVGGVTKLHPFANMALKLMQVNSANDLAKTMVAVGLMQNFAALRALAQDGIVSGHMRLQINNLLLSVDASDSEKKQLKSILSNHLTHNKKVTITDVKNYLAEIRK